MYVSLSLYKYKYIYIYICTHLFFVIHVSYLHIVHTLIYTNISFLHLKLPTCAGAGRVGRADQGGVPPHRAGAPLPPEGTLIVIIIIISSSISSIILIISIVLRATTIRGKHLSNTTRLRSVFKISCLFLRTRPWQFEI